MLGDSHLAAELQNGPREPRDLARVRRGRIVAFMADHLPARPPDTPADGAPPSETCDVCGSADLREIRCKVICGNCRTILRSCADL